MSEPHSIEELFSIAELQRDVADLRTEFGGLRTAMAEQTAATKELVEAWKAAGSLVKFVKWASTLVTAFGAIWLAVRWVWGGAG